MHAPRSDLHDIADVTAHMLARLRERRPRVHCITNAVAQNFTANILLAVGAIPSMTIAADEVAAFAASADALLVNLGTFDAERRAASETAIAQMRKSDRPWVLDPALIDRSPQRAAFARKLVTLSPAAIRLNAAEFKALASDDDLRSFSEDHRAVIAQTGETDIVTDGKRVMKIANGHPLMARVTAMGCAESAVVAAALTVIPDPFEAVVAAVLAFGVAGDIAGRAAAGPGSFAMHLQDALFHLDAGALREHAKVQS